MNTRSFKLKNTDIILQDFEFGRGKIIISGDYDLSYTWGAMNSTLSEFITRIDSDYFMRNLNSIHQDPIDIKKSLRNFRTDLRRELPWYKYLEFQKELRSEIKRTVRYIEDDHSFVDAIIGLKDQVDYDLVDDKYDRKEVRSIIHGICSEPWHYLENIEHPQKKWLTTLHKDLVKYLKVNKENLVPQE